MTTKRRRRRDTHLSGLASGLGGELFTRSLAWRKTKKKSEKSVDVVDDDDEPPVDLRAVCWQIRVSKVPERGLRDLLGKNTDFCASHWRFEGLEDRLLVVGRARKARFRVAETPKTDGRYARDARATWKRRLGSRKIERLFDLSFLLTF
jgi:hypothetical protein